MMEIKIAGREYLQATIFIIKDNRQRNSKRAATGLKNMPFMRIANVTKNLTGNIQFLFSSFPVFYGMFLGQYRRCCAEKKAKRQ